MVMNRSPSMAEASLSRNESGSRRDDLYPNDSLRRNESVASGYGCVSTSLLCTCGEDHCTMGQAHRRTSRDAKEFSPPKPRRFCYRSK
jgi:hypothetical protein